MINRADIPELVFPDRRMKEVDGIALGKELTGLIRGAKTRGAVNKALAQYGTLASPEAIASVRQNMGTWFSDPGRIIELQDSLATRQQKEAELALETRKTDLTETAAEAESKRREAEKISKREQLILKSDLEGIDTRISALQTLLGVEFADAQEKRQYFDEIKRLSNQRDILVRKFEDPTYVVPKGPEVITPTEQATLNEEAKAEKLRIVTENISGLPTEDILRQLPDSRLNPFELQDRLESAFKDVNITNERIREYQERLENAPNDRARASYQKRIDKETASLQEYQKKFNALRKKAEKQLIDTQLKREQTLNTGESDSLEGRGGVADGPGLEPNLQSSVDVIDNVMQLALNSPQGQEMMRRFMEEQQIG